MENSIHQALINIQGELKAPKTNYNKFGNYAYRSAEDILEALKPILQKNNCILTLSDDIILIGNRFYIKAIATLSNEKESITACAMAREDESKKGMDGAQITGSCSSYARKYALNGLFAIDDTKDSDATNTHGQATKQVVKPQQQAQSNSNYSKAQEDEELAEAVAEAIDRVKRTKTRKELESVYKNYPNLKGNTKFIDACAQQGKLLKP